MDEQNNTTWIVRVWLCICSAVMVVGIAWIFAWHDIARLELEKEEAWKTESRAMDRENRLIRIR